jgi:hypothetical protein
LFDLKRDLNVWLTAADYKKPVNPVQMGALYTLWYNFARINSSVRMPPAMAAGLSDCLWEIGEIVNPIDEGDDRKV